MEAKILKELGKNTPKASEIYMENFGLVSCSFEICSFDFGIKDLRLLALFCLSISL